MQISFEIRIQNDVNNISSFTFIVLKFREVNFNVKAIQSE